MTETSKPPKVQSQGIPALERAFLAASIRLTARFYSKDRITAMFREEAHLALELASRLSLEEGQRRVRIPRFFGVEAESCDWSVFMTLEHLVIANTAITAQLPRLYSGRDPCIDFPLEDLKPVPSAGPEQIESLATLRERYTEVVDKLGNLHAGSRCPHPWFGNFSAAQWHALAAFHTSTHRRQIERILKVR
ncbi:DinB superfamily protein [Thiorhodovibrio winogradskyi]|uniref:DinB superfamily protein n=1 Tax=Thiorhodovibrio winogradskyi TaxID=77007 RepID=A0ABZ0S6B6_9GAMM|nr:DinB family protein [Thiorhodovibrio winogradskyi]